jgi:dipeptide transport system permease protein
MFLKRLMKGDLGETIWTRQKVWIEVKQRFPATIELALCALCISLFFRHYPRHRLRHQTVLDI